MNQIIEIEVTNGQLSGIKCSPGYKIDNLTENGIITISKENNCISEKRDPFKYILGLRKKYYKKNL